MCTVGLEGGEDWPDIEAYMSVALREGVRAGDHEAAGIAAFTLGALEVERGRYHGRRGADSTSAGARSLDVVRVGTASTSFERAPTRASGTETETVKAQRAPLCGVLPAV